MLVGHSDKGHPYSDNPCTALNPWNNGTHRKVKQDWRINNEENINYVRIKYLTLIVLDLSFVDLHIMSVIDLDLFFCHIHGPESVHHKIQNVHHIFQN